MKKKTLFLTLAVLGAVACNKNAAPSQIPEGALPTGAITVKVSSEDATKAAAISDYQINSVQVFVFDKTGGRLETDTYVGGLSDVKNSHSVTLNTLTGNKIVYALLNHPRMYLKSGSAGEELSSFEGTLTDLKENTPTNLVMSGRAEITVVDANQNGTVVEPQTMDIYVKRLATQIKLASVTPNFAGTSLEGATFSVKKIYLKNVVGKSPVGVQGNTASAESTVLPYVLSTDQLSDNSNWYNKMKEESGAPACVSDECNLTGTALSGMSRMLFTYPNATSADNNGSGFSARHTRLVIKAHVTKTDITDKDTYYVLDLPVLVANNVYTINNVKVSMLGKDEDNDDSDIDVGRITPSIKVDPWSGEATLNYEY